MERRQDPIYNAEWAKTIVDLEDQGVCMDGHDCHLIVFAAGDLGRECDGLHKSDDWSGSRHYRGWPLLRQDLTFDQIAEYANRPGADHELALWAEAYVADRIGAAELEEERA